MVVAGGAFLQQAGLSAPARRPLMPCQMQQWRHLVAVSKLNLGATAPDLPEGAATCPSVWGTSQAAPHACLTGICKPGEAFHRSCCCCCRQRPWPWAAWPRCSLRQPGVPGAAKRPRPPEEAASGPRTVSTCAGEGPPLACFRPRRSPCDWTAPKPSPPAPKAPREQPWQPIAEPFGRACAALAYLGLKLLLLLVQVGRGRHVVPPDPELVFLGVPGPRGTGGLRGQPLPGPPGPIRSCCLALASPAARAAIGLLPPGRAEHLCRQPLPTFGTRPNGGRVKQTARCPQQRTPSPSLEGASYGFSGGGSW